MRASEACVPCESTCEACEPFMRTMWVNVRGMRAIHAGHASHIKSLSHHDLNSFLTCFHLFLFFFNVNYETNLFKVLCGVMPVFLVSRFSMLYSLRWLSVSLWRTLAVLPAKDTVNYAECYISITLRDGWRIFWALMPIYKFSFRSLNVSCSLWLL